jgi:hypothetical protein
MQTYIYIPPVYAQIHTYIQHAYIHTYQACATMPLILTQIQAHQPTYIHTFIHIHIRTHKHTHIHARRVLLCRWPQLTYRHTNLHTYRHTSFIHTYAHTNTHTYMPGVCHYAFLPTHIRTHTHTHACQACATMPLVSIDIPSVSLPEPSCIRVYIHIQAILFENGWDVDKGPPQISSFNFIQTFI